MPRTPEKSFLRTERKTTTSMKDHGAAIYRKFQIGQGIYFGPLLGGYPYNQQDNEHAADISDVLRRAAWQLGRSEADLREDHEIFGYDPAEVAKTNFKDQLRSLLEGIKEAAHEEGDIKVVRAAKKIIEISLQTAEQGAGADNGIPLDLEQLLGSFGIDRAARGGTVIVITPHGTQTVLPQEDPKKKFQA